MILTIDIGGTNIKYGLCDASGNIQQKGGYPNVIKLRNDGFEGNTKNVLLFFLWKI